MFLTPLKKNAESILLNVTSDQQKLRRLIDLIQPVDELYKSMDAQRKIAEGHRATITRYLTNIKVFQDSINRLDITLKDWDNEDSNLNRSLVTWDAELREYSYWTAEQKKGAEKLKETETLLQEKHTALNDKINRRQALDESRRRKNTVLYRSLTSKP